MLYKLGEQPEQSLLGLIADARSALREGAAGLARRQRSRIADLVAYARANSGFYRQLYRDLPQRVEDPTTLPVTDKRALMSRFDEWATDRAVTLQKARAFAENPDLIGEPFLGRYTLATTSGTTGTRGIFVSDDRAVAVRNALLLRALSAWLAPRDWLQLLAGGGRTAMVLATGGHFTGYVGVVSALRSGSPLRRRALRVFSVHTPLPELVQQLNRFRPVVLVGYASVITLLAGEQEAGRLDIRPALVLPMAEGLAPDEFRRVSEAFGAKAHGLYAATECLHIAYTCAHGWLHVNTDWVVLEPVDTDHRPVPPGQPSHTVLVSNLANRVQPILRYDLGDGVLLRPDPCPCGSPLPAIRVQGRTADLLRFPAGQGVVSLAPLVLVTLMDHLGGVERFQVVQATPNTLRVRLLVEAGADPEAVWQAVRDGLTRLLADHRLGHVRLERAEEPPEQSAGGKYRPVIPLEPNREAGQRYG